ncbi:hypothetical protein VTJ83DRAFT_7054 [Remersonia thermophila]|uniref:RING-type domain-containing protein n=1 Tax=Remersonia thermophila TaxID=72144 RepID=A0ABR4D3G4_9PEZI
MDAPTDIYDLLIVTDATASMGSFLTSLNASLQDIIRISAATDCFSRIGVLAYRDYDSEESGLLTEWSGWYSRLEDGAASAKPADEPAEPGPVPEPEPEPDAESRSRRPKPQRSNKKQASSKPPKFEPKFVDRDGLLSFVAGLVAHWGGDWPEATRTGLAHAYQAMRPEAKTIILLYADAPPHSQLQDGDYAVEQKALAKPDAYGGAGPGFADWVHGANQLRNGEKKAQVFCLIEASQEGYAIDYVPPFAYLSAATGGLCVGLYDTDQASISRTTVALLLAWMGVTKDGASLAAGAADPAVLALYSYDSADDLADLASEADPRAGRYLYTRARSGDRPALAANLRRDPLDLDGLAALVPRCERPAQDFSKRYAADPAYRALVVEQVGDIIAADVSALTLNPVFGTLWRTVCNDRANPARDRLLADFSRALDGMDDPDEKARMKAWLDESYDWAGEIMAIVAAVPEAERFPCVLLDPTAVRLEAPGEGGNRGDGDDDGDDDDAEEEDAQRLRKLTRDELLDLGRACDRRIQRRLGRVLTRLTYVDDAASLPAHLHDVPEDVVPRIPTALAKPEHQRRFWRVLLHTILPGTMLSARPAALLAALSVRMGIRPLRQAALAELALWRDRWNTLDIPETWNSSCLGLLLEADRAHREAVARAEEEEEEEEEEREEEGKQRCEVSDRDAVLAPEDRRLFQTLVDYKLLELNLDTKLTAKIGWTPDKSPSPVGPLVRCQGCDLPRSVTMMGAGSLCGLCLAARNPSLGPEDRATYEDLRRGGAAPADDEATLATWVECSVRTCRAQYVVYHPSRLNVRPKCHRCRYGPAKGDEDGGDPSAYVATCAACANRVVYPAAYRPPGFDAARYACPACARTGPGGPRAAVDEVDTSARQLRDENGAAWLLKNQGGAIRPPLGGRSLFHVVSHSPLAPGALSELPGRVAVLPALADPAAFPLALRGKPLLNAPALLAALSSRVAARRTDASPCPLCLATRPARLLLPACGGRAKGNKTKAAGCGQRACRACLERWYRAPHRRGRVLFPAALACPFCRADLASSSAAARRLLPRDVRRMPGLRDALAERGEWVYAWCAGPCGGARRFGPRVCVAAAEGAAGQDVDGWVCDGCAAAEAAAGAARSGEAGPLVVKMCPACDVAVEKTAGCDQISCQCGKHWCFGCGEFVADSMAEVYAHMTSAHRTWGGEEEWELEEDEEEADDDHDDDHHRDRMDEE